MTTDQSLLILIADLNAQIHALQADNKHLREELGATREP